MIRIAAIAFCTLGFLGFVPSESLAQISDLPPVSTAWQGPIIFQNGEMPETLYQPQIEHDGDGICVAGWSDTLHINGTKKGFIFLARSTDGGLTWGEPFDLPDAQDYSTRQLGGLAAGENGVWMAVTTGGVPNPLEIVISKNSGETWKKLIDVTDKFPPEQNLSATLRQFLVVYCGNSSWIVIKDTSHSIRYIRSTDNGENWGPLITLAETNGHSKIQVASHYDGSKVLITYYDSTLEDPVSLFSTDNGQSFVPTADAVAGGTDGNGNWIFVGTDAQDGGLPVMHSSDYGVTFNSIPGPPDTDLTISPAKVIYTDSGKIIVVATAFVQLGSFLSVQVTGLFSITEDLGQTWTPWKRIHDNLANTPIDMIANPAGQFITVFGLNDHLQSYRYVEPVMPASAYGWELYE